MLDTVDIAATTGLLEQISKLVAHATDIFQSLQAQAEATHERLRPRSSHFFECHISAACDACAGLGAYRVGSGLFRRSCQVHPHPPSPAPRPRPSPLADARANRRVRRACADTEKTFYQTQARRAHCAPPLSGPAQPHHAMWIGWIAPPFLVFTYAV